MAIIKNLLIRNNPYDGVRMVVQGHENTDDVYYYTEAQGNRYYYTNVGSTASPEMESSTFEAFISVTQSATVLQSYDLIVLNPGETVFIESIVSCMNATASKAYLCKAFGGYKHDGNTISLIGSTIDYTEKTDFSSSISSIYSHTVPYGSSHSIHLDLYSDGIEVLDWDIHIKYTKGYHTVLSGTASEPPVVYPPAPNYPTE